MIFSHVWNILGNNNFAPLWIVDEKNMASSEVNCWERLGNASCVATLTKVNWIIKFLKLLILFLMCFSSFRSEDSQCSLTFLFFTLEENKNTFLLCSQPGHHRLFDSIPRDYHILSAAATNILMNNTYSKDVLRIEKLIQHQKSEMQRVGHVDENAGKLHTYLILFYNSSSIVSQCVWRAGSKQGLVVPFSCRLQIVNAWRK